MSMHQHLLLKLPLRTQSSLSQSLPLKLQTSLNSHPLFQFHFTLSPKSNNFLLPLCRSSRRDPNAESFMNKRLNFNINKNERPKSKYFHEVDEDGDDEFKSDEPWAAALEEYIDSIWILKVFSSYGWSLPFIILSILLASGLKAFLMALALPLAQSTIWFLLQKIWGSTNSKTRHKMKSKRTSRERHSSSAFTAKRDRKEKRAYPSWVPGKDISADNGGNYGDADFGGWDELDSGRDSTRGSPKSEQRASRSKWRSPKKDNFTRLEHRSDTPLLLRLLVSVFPFIGWWIKMF